MVYFSQPPFCIRSSSATALVEFVIADGGELQAHQVHRVDGRLVEEIGRGQRRGADQVAGGNGDRVGMTRAKIGQLRAR